MSPPPRHGDRWLRWICLPCSSRHKKVSLSLSRLFEHLKSTVSWKGLVFSLAPNVFKRHPRNRHLSDALLTTFPWDTAWLLRTRTVSAAGSSVLHVNGPPATEIVRVRDYLVLLLLLPFFSVFPRVEHTQYLRRLPITSGEAYPRKCPPSPVIPSWNISSSFLPASIMDADF